MVDRAVKREVDVDEALVAEAARGLGTSSRVETINAALREFVHAKRAERSQALARIRRMAAEGLFDFDFDAIDRANR